MNPEEVANLRAMWRAALGSGSGVILDGFHAIKHAIRFGASIDQILTSDMEGALSMARELAPDIEYAISSTAQRLAPEFYGWAVPHKPAASIVALARRSAPKLDLLDQLVRGTPLVLLDDPKNLGNIGAAIRVAAGMGASGTDDGRR